MCFKADKCEIRRIGVEKLLFVHSCKPVVQDSSTPDRFERWALFWSGIAAQVLKTLFRCNLKFKVDIYSEQKIMQLLKLHGSVETLQTS